MKTAIMQPYFLPYIGYWQILHAVDQFVILDDVNYIKRGYINRNSILIDGKPFRFTIPVQNASQNRRICDTRLCFSIRQKKNLVRTISNAYKRAPCYPEVMSLIEGIINFEEEDLTTYIFNSIQKVVDYLNIKTELYLSSKLEKNKELKSEDRIIEICKVMATDIYINPWGGRKLYDHEHFKKENIKLLFLNTRKTNILYRQENENFEPDLSVIDLLMYNEKKAIQKYLTEYDLIE